MKFSANLESEIKFASKHLRSKYFTRRKANFIEKSIDKVDAFFARCPLRLRIPFLSKKEEDIYKVDALFFLAERKG